MPFGSHGGYNVTVPGGWVNNAGGDARFDYAVIEFSGYGDFPGRASGWKGLWVAPDNVVTGNRMYLYGHPSDKAQPQIWATRATAGPTASTSTSSWTRGTATAVPASTSTTPTAGPMSSA